MNNSSLQHEGNEQAPGPLVAWSLAYGLVDVVILLGNVITLLVFFTNKKLLRMRANYFLINLAIADIMVGTFAIPMYVYHFIAALYKGDGVWKHFSYKIYVSVDVFVGCASIFTLTFIALERAFSVCLPQIHRHAREKTYYGLLGSIWLLSILVFCLRFLFETGVLQLEVFFYVLLIAFSIALLIICVSYVVIWFKMKFRFANRDGNKRKREQDKRLAIILFAVTVVFVLTWMPFQIINIVAFFCEPCRMNMSNNSVNFAKFLHYGNSCVNPIIYSFLVPEFKKTVFRIFRKLRNNDDTRISTFEMHSAKT
ncbi:muscarinic acetylcholine receptor M2-like [Stylophora pistillata]|uniref:muscarinic acetylcholine receptor M2-like n=1 Tax=Stylophora pistillata TaxID=50429 RepID=UPI000C0563DF|nr:muscarinic acetylcholine receptor M2-like [Stylophora pistillata]XP_022789223.1 muscarinic acetylcholine receptor M2-like [Stylophora pistillata]XP_022789224.1 muscarinic acetylcholine receptor M2-like [Stylophora pistillata]XP_022789225.1 muscarinic acetylcholine receptor M2-like [Stylophora pistillata]XP_022789226.1 muscarinic acetylcholine receptor M2-like [Stylophora pistillata]